MNHTLLLKNLLLLMLAFVSLNAQAQTIPSIGTIPPGKSLIIVYDVTINNGTTQVSNQGTVSGTNFNPFLTNDPKTLTANDATVTEVVSLGPERLYVNASATGSGTGLDWANAFTDLQSALGYPESASLKEIWVAQGTYYPSTTDRMASFVMKNGVAIYGGFPTTGTPTLTERDWVAYPTILSGDINKNNELDAADSEHVIYNNFSESNPLTSSAVLDGFTITGGYASSSGSGGGMENRYASPTLTNCSFTGNRATGNAAYGGGMYNERSSPTLTNCSFAGNSANGTSGRGGGMYNTSSSPTLINCSFAGNSANAGALGYGGGMYNISSSPTLTNCSFAGNSANGTNGRGGGMYNTSSSPTLTNCSFAGNNAKGSSSAYGGGMYNAFSSPTLTNCSFAGNRVNGGDGGGMYNLNSSPTLTNCILWGNSADGNPEISGSVTLNYSLVKGLNPGGTNLDGTNPANDPLFLSPPNAANAPTTAGNLRLSACSPAINAGDNAADLDGPTRTWDGAEIGTGTATIANILTDLAGKDRIYANGIIDLGAYEYQGEPSQPLSITTQPLASATVCAGSGAEASVVVTGTVTSYQWYKGNLAVDGQTTATLSLTNVQTTDGGSYTLQINGACDTLTSQAFVLTVDPASVGGTATATSATVCTGTGTTITLSGQTGTIQWQSSTTNNGSDWANINGQTSATLSTGNLTATTYYRAVLTSGVCSTATSTTASVTVSPNLEGGTATATASTVCTGTGTTITLSGHTGNIQWQSSSTNNGSDWANISGQTTATLSTGNLTATTYYRAVLTSGACPTAFSSVATVTVSPVSVGGTAAATAATVCTGTGTTITLSSHTGSIQWQSSTTNNGTDWANISGQTTASLSTGNLTATTYFRALVTSGSCTAANSSVATVTVTPVTAATVSGTTTVNQNATAPTLTFTVTGGTAPYTFHYTLNSGSQTQLATTGVATTATLTQPTSTVGSYVYALVKVVDANGCEFVPTSAQTATITVGSDLTASINGSTAVCKDATAPTLIFTAT
ncbi:right-handed parallel beta-helix repeat-containing protein, partial [Telluribacter sp.]|uniref:beta strand repeat-containing protein n=1 Tax=Telluribacter sp. TaxID=1978767 RepID=UPI002E118348|nr:right-handed parallel beta-helix repeat-containing protein [Telluribacter sp.]